MSLNDAQLKLSLGQTRFQRYNKTIYKHIIKQPAVRFLTVSYLCTNVGSFLDCADSQADSLEYFSKVRKGSPS